MDIKKRIWSSTAGWQVRARSCTVFFLVVYGRYGRLKRLVYGYILSPGVVPASTFEVIFLRRSGLLGKLSTNVRIIADRGFRGAGPRVVAGENDTKATVEEQMSNRRLAFLKWQVETAFSE